MQTEDISKLPQVILARKLAYLVPNAKFDIRELNDDSWRDENSFELNGMLVNWNPANGILPSLESINNVTDAQINAMDEVKRKLARDEKYSKDLSMKAAYRIELKENPGLMFSEFLDELENS